MVGTKQKKEEGETEDKNSRADSRRASAKKVLEMEKDVWKGRIREDAGTETLGSCHRAQGGFYTKKRESVLTIQEREEVQVFMEDQLRKGYIQPSKSPQTLPVHFVAKKYGKRRMVQNY